MKFINDRDWQSLSPEFQQAQPFRHIVLDNFFQNDVAQQLLREFPDYNSDVWNVYYNNPLENKKACDHWLRFPPTTYQVFNFFCSTEFEQVIEQITGHGRVYADIGLHGGGWHAHANSGKLNIHLDYSIHPKLNLERHFNLIIYLTPDWNPQWGGGLELWSHDPATNRPLTCINTVENQFNRAVLFDTTQNSWHGLPKNLTCPPGIIRRSLAMYYVTEPTKNVVSRPRALFAPYGDQVDDPQILELIEKRQKL